MKRFPKRKSILVSLIVVNANVITLFFYSDSFMESIEEIIPTMKAIDVIGVLTILVIINLFVFFLELHDQGITNLVKKNIRDGDTTKSAAEIMKEDEQKMRKGSHF